MLPCSRFILRTATRQTTSFRLISLTTTTPRASVSSIDEIASHRNYTSRAHPSPVPEFAVSDAVRMVLDGVQERVVRREEKWERNRENREKKGIKDDGPYRNQDETIEIALNLNVDPRKPGESLRGSIPLPHGSGKKIRCIVFTDDDTVASAALEAGAIEAGGDSLIEQISSGSVPLNFDVALASPDMVPRLGRVARILGPRGLMPNAKTGTVQSTDRLPTAVQDQMTGMVQYRTDKAGIVHAGIAKGSFGEEKILDNVRAFMNAMLDVKPESYGRGKKKGGGGKKKGKSNKKNPKYLLRVHLTSTQGKGYKLDLRTVDPTSTFFMGTVQS